MDYRVLTHVGKTAEVRVHHGAPRPPDIVGHVCRNGGHQPLRFDHGKGTRKAGPPRNALALE